VQTGELYVASEG